jgi:hypothetical protein
MLMVNTHITYIQGIYMQQHHDWPFLDPLVYEMLNI